MVLPPKSSGLDFEITGKDGRFPETIVSDHVHHLRFAFLVLPKLFGGNTIGNRDSPDIEDDAPSRDSSVFDHGQPNGLIHIPTTSDLEIARCVVDQKLLFWQGGKLICAHVHDELISANIKAGALVADPIELLGMRACDGCKGVLAKGEFDFLVFKHCLFDGIPSRVGIQQPAHGFIEMVDVIHKGLLVISNTLGQLRAICRLDGKWFAYAGHPARRIYGL
jgi:hypothetical protein